jgi:hypothetical protein
MAIVKCPSCDNKVSSQIRICPQCGFKRGEVDEQELRELRRRGLRDRIYYLKMASYAVLTVLLATFGWYWVETESFRYQSSPGPYVLFAIGAMAYFVIRVFLFKSSLALRKIKRD